MGPNEDRVREEMARSADIARGLGTSLGVADMRHYGDMLAEAALTDSFRCPRCGTSSRAAAEFRDPCPGCGYQRPEDRYERREREFHERLNREMREAAE